MPFKLFISHKSSINDINTARSLKQYFEGIPNTQVYIYEDDSRSGQLTENILQELRTSDVVIILLSAMAYNSSWVQQEIGAARASNKIVLPFLLDRNVRPDGMLAGYRYYAFYDAASWQNTLPSLYSYISQLAQERTNSENAGKVLLVGAILGLGLFFFGAGNQ